MITIRQQLMNFTRLHIQDIYQTHPQTAKYAIIKYAVFISMTVVTATLSGNQNHQLMKILWNKYEISSFSTTQGC